MDHPYTLTRQHVLEGERELLVLVTDEELGLGRLLVELPAKVSRLLADPLLVRVRGHPTPHDAPGGQLHKEGRRAASGSMCRPRSSREPLSRTPGLTET